MTHRLANGLGISSLSPFKLWFIIYEQIACNLGIHILGFNFVTQRNNLVFILVNLLLSSSLSSLSIT
jgi:hypothetical protein